MALVGYRPEPELGGYSFQADDGTEQFLFGPEADALARQMDELRAREPQPTAMAGAGGASGVPDTGAPVPGMGGAGGAPAGGPDAMASVGRSGAGEGFLHTGQVTPDPVALQYQPPPPEAAPAPVASPAPQPAAAPPGPDPFARRMVQVAPQREGYVPTQMSVKRTEVPFTPQQEEAVWQARADELRVRKALADEATARHESNAAMMAAQLPALERQAAEERARLQEDERRVQQQWGQVEQAVQAYRQKEIDPRRLFRERGTLATIGAVIASAGGAWAATLSGGQNYAQQIIDAAIDRDIAAQEQEIHTLGDDAQNMLALYNRQFGDMERAKLALDSTMRQIAATEAQAHAEFAQGAEQQNALALFLAEQQRKWAENANEFRNRGIAEMSESYQFQQGRSGGMRPESDAEYTRRLKGAADRAGYMRDIYGEPDPKQGSKLQENLGKQKAEIATARTGLKQLARAYGVELKDNGEVSRPEGWGGISGHGATSWVPNALLTEEGRSVRQAQDKAVADLVRAISGAAATDAERENLGGILKGTYDQDALRGLERAWEALNEKERATEAAYPRGIVQQYRGRVTEERRGANQRAQERPVEEEY